jgi:hypothetical protein
MVGLYRIPALRATAHLCILKNTDRQEGTDRCAEDRLIRLIPMIRCSFRFESVSGDPARILLALAS